MLNQYLNYKIEEKTLFRLKLSKLCLRNKRRFYANLVKFFFVQKLKIILILI